MLGLAAAMTWSASAHAWEVRTEAFIVESTKLGSLAMPDLRSMEARKKSDAEDQKWRIACDQALLGDHAIQAGTKVVIGIRRYFHDPGVLDADTFWKMSVEIPKLRLGEPISLDAPGVRSIYTGAAEAWYPGCNGARAMPLKGEMVLRRLGDGVEATFRIDTPAEYLSTFLSAHKAGNFRLEETLPLRTMTLQQLDAWEAGASPPAVRRAKP